MSYESTKDTPNCPICRWSPTTPAEHLFTHCPHCNLPLDVPTDEPAIVSSGDYDPLAETS